MAWVVHPNIVSPQTVTVVQDVMYKFILAFEAGWGAGAVRMSGDGQALYSATGNVFTLGTNVTTPGNIGNGNAWFVVAPPDDSYFMLWRRPNVGGVGLNCWWSYAPFTGGDPATPPTSPGEIQITTSGFITWDSSPTYLGAVTHGIFGDASEDYSFGIFNYVFGAQPNTSGTFPTTTGTCVTGGAFVDVAKRSFLNRNQERMHIVSPAVQNSVAQNLPLTISDVRSDLQSGSASNNIRAYAFFEGSSQPMVPVAQAVPIGANFTRTQAYQFGWPGQHDRGIDMWPLIWMQSNRGYSGEPLVKGESRLFRMTTAPNRTLGQQGWNGPLTFTDDLNWWLLGASGALAVPWDGVTNAYMAYEAP